MKILQIYKSYYPETTGGIECAINHLSYGLHKHAIQCDILTTTCTSDSHEKKYQDFQKAYYFTRNFTLSSCPVSLSLLKNFKRITQTYDLLHFQFPWPFADILALLIRHQKPYVISYQSDIIKQNFLKIFYQPIMHQFFKNSQAIICSSENLMHSSPALQSYQDKIKIIPIGLNKELYINPSQHKILYWQKQLSEWGNISQQYFLFIGVLRYYKGLDILLKAVKNTSLSVIIGGTGPLENDLKKQAQKYNLKQVYFTGYLSEEDKIILMQYSKAIISSAHLRSEAFCISLLEGLMFGKPLISTQLNTGTSFVNQDDFTGIVVPPDDPNALQDAMIRLSTDSALYERFKKNTAIHYDTYFTGKKMADQHAQLYQSILNKNYISH